MKGFTIIELLLVIAITAIIGAAIIPAGSGFLVRNYHKNKTNEIVSSLRTAQLSTISGKGDSAWGVKTTESQIVLFQGSSYASRNTAFDQAFDIPGSITVTQGEVVFSKLTGNPGSTATFSITSNVGDSAIVAVNAVGTVDVL